MLTAAASSFSTALIWKATEGISQAVVGGEQISDARRWVLKEGSVIQDMDYILYIIKWKGGEQNQIGATPVTGLYAYVESNNASFPTLFM